MIHVTSLLTSYFVLADISIALSGKQVIYWHLSLWHFSLYLCSSFFSAFLIISLDESSSDSPAYGSSEHISVSGTVGSDGVKSKCDKSEKKVSLLYYCFTKKCQVIFSKNLKGNFWKRNFNVFFVFRKNALLAENATLL